MIIPVRCFTCGKVQQVAHCCIRSFLFFTPHGAPRNAANRSEIEGKKVLRVVAQSVLHLVHFVFSSEKHPGCGTSEENIDTASRAQSQFSFLRRLRRQG